MFVKLRRSAKKENKCELAVANTEGCSVACRKRERKRFKKRTAGSPRVPLCHLFVRHSEPLIEPADYSGTEKLEDHHVITEKVKPRKCFLALNDKSCLKMESEQRMRLTDHSQELVQNSSGFIDRC